MRAVNNWAVAFVFAGAIAFALPSAAQMTGGSQAGGGQPGDTGQTGGGGGQGAGTGGGATAGPGSANSQGNLQKFVDQVAVSNMAEIQLSQLAQQKSQDPQVKQYAQTMIDQHTQAQNQLQQIASQSGLNLPTSLDKKHQQIQDSLSRQNGAAFDRAYVKAMVKDHQQAEKLLQTRANRSASIGTGQAPAPSGTTGSATAGATGSSGEVSSIDQYAATTLPTVQQHLQMAKDLQAQVKSEGKNSQKNNKGGQ